jgi:cell division protease FtsH
MTEEEKRRVATHEGGHALVALSVAHADPVHRVTIIPRSIGALGATLQLPTQEHFLMSREELRDRICVLLAGRAAEELECPDISTGSEDDLERATEIARQMVCRFGMSDSIGPVTVGDRSPARVPSLAFELESSHALSEESKRLIDAEIKSVLTQENARARDLLGVRSRTLRAIANELLSKETLQRAELEAIFKTTEKEGAAIAEESQPRLFPKSA